MPRQLFDSNAQQEAEAKRAIGAWARPSGRLRWARQGSFAPQLEMEWTNEDRGDTPPDTVWLTVPHVQLPS